MKRTHIFNIVTRLVRASADPKERRLKGLMTRSLAVGTITLFMSGVVLAGNDCSLKTLRGSFVFTASGFTVVGDAAQPKSLLEVIDFNGDGTLSVPAATRSVNGVLLRTPPGGVGTYTVDQGCTGTLAFGGGPTFDIFVSPKADKIWMIQTNAGGAVFQGAAESAQTVDQPCSNATLKGAYGLSIGGTRPAPFVAPDVRAFAGQIEQVLGTVVQIFDGQGNFTQVDNVKGSIAGIVPDRAGRGVYTVNPDCSVTQVVSPPGQAQITSKGVIVDGAREFRQNTVSPDGFMISTIGRKMN